MEIVELLLLDGNAALVGVDLDTSSLLPLLIIQIASDHCDHSERADDGVETVAIHRLGFLFWICPCALFWEDARAPAAAHGFGVDQYYS
jgi:hypothetical protein